MYRIVAIQPFGCNTVIKFKTKSQEPRSLHPKVQLLRVPARFQHIQLETIKDLKPAPSIVRPPGEYKGLNTDANFSSVQFSSVY